MEGMDKLSCTWRAEHEILFSVSYWGGRNEMLLEIYDKRGKVRSKLTLDQKMLEDLKHDIDICLGNIREQEED